MSALLQIEDEILLLAAEVNYCKKEVGMQKGEMEQIARVADTQIRDVKDYLKKEVVILDEVIVKQRIRQNAEYSRLYRQCTEVEQLRKDIEVDRLKIVDRVVRV